MEHPVREALQPREAPREGPRQAVCAVGMKSEERGMHGRMENRLLGARGHWSGMVIDRTITMGSFSFLKRSRRFD